VSDTPCLKWTKDKSRFFVTAATEADLIHELVHLRLLVDNRTLPYLYGSFNALIHAANPEEFLCNAVATMHCPHLEDEFQDLLEYIHATGKTLEIKKHLESLPYSFVERAIHLLVGSWKIRGGRGEKEV